MSRGDLSSARFAGYPREVEPWLVALSLDKNGAY
jgi:hypothetical protein